MPNSYDATEWFGLDYLYNSGTPDPQARAKSNTTTAKKGSGSPPRKTDPNIGPAAADAQTSNLTNRARQSNGR